MTNARRILVCVTVALAASWTHGQKRIALTSTDGSPDGFIRSVLVERDLIWVGTDNGGLYRLDRRQPAPAKALKAKELRGARIQALAASATSVWIGTDKGLLRADTHGNAVESLADAKAKKEENDIRCLRLAGNRLWVGTASGPRVFDTDKNKWTDAFGVTQSLSQPTSVILVERSFVWFGTDNGISRIDTATGHWTHFRQEEWLHDTRILSGRYDARFVWFGNRRGICGYNIFDKSWISFDIADGLVDNVVQAMCIDGRYLWTGTFAGLSRLDIESLVWDNFSTVKGLESISINALALDGDVVWIGTDGSGLIALNKDVPQCRIDGVATEGSRLYVLGTIADSDNQLYSLEYGPRIFPFVGFRKGVDISSRQSAFRDTVGSLSLDEMADGEYLIRLHVIDKQGHINEDYFPFTLDVRGPQIVIDSLPSFASTEKCRVAGSFYGTDIAEITVEPGGRKAKLDAEKRTFSATVVLREGENQLKIVARDARGRSSETNAVVIRDTAPPAIALGKQTEFANSSQFTLTGTCKDANPKHVEIEPPLKRIVLKQDTADFSLSVTLKPGRNDFTVRAVDMADNAATAAKTVYLDTIPPLLTLAHVDAYSRTPTITLAGAYADEHISTIALMPQQTGASIDTAAKSFSLKTSLHEGTNLFTLQATDLASNSSSVSFSVEADFTPPRLRFSELPAKTDEQTVVVQGGYTESQLDKIVVLPAAVNAIITEESHTFKATVPLASGTNKITVKAVDRAENESTYDFVVLRSSRADTSSVTLGRDEFMKTQDRMTQLAKEVQTLEAALAKKESAATQVAEASQPDEAGRTKLAALEQQVLSLQRENADLKKRPGAETSTPSQGAAVEGHEARVTIRYRVRQNEYLSSIARRFYGDASLYTTIARYNGLSEVDTVPAGTVVRVPLWDGIDISPYASKEFHPSLPTRYVQVNVGVVRKDPAASSEKVGNVLLGEIVAVFEAQEGWSHVESRSGIRGWIKSSLLTDELR